MDIILATLKHNNILLKFKSIYFKEKLFKCPICKSVGPNGLRAVSYKVRQNGGEACRNRWIKVHFWMLFGPMDSWGHIYPFNECLPQ